jgi:hypothetical protein
MSSPARPLFRSAARPGYSQLVSAHPKRMSARKIVREVDVRFTPTACTVKTREGLVHALPGDAIITSGPGEQWRVSRAHFAEKYRPVPPVKAGDDGRYTSLPNRIIAVQVHEPFDVLLADGVSQLSGQTGDWLVDHGDGSLGIVGAPIFAKTYELVT